MDLDRVSIGHVLQAQNWTLSRPQREHAELVFRFFIDNYFKVLRVGSSHFRRAGEISGREDINIRAADALHLAVAEANGATICTLDNKMDHAARILEITCLVP